jgi:DNA polymerase
VTDAERGAALEAIAAEIRVCSRCRLHENRAKAVPGEGNPDTEVVIVGEGPGRDENQAGRPFVGASGRLLTELIESLGWRRDDVFITNVVKCWPPGNRDPAPDEIAACAPYLHRQLEVLDPAVVVTAGKHSLGVFMPGERISRVHGTARPADPATGARDALVLAMYHPAFALYDGSNRSTLFTDIQGLPTTLEAARARRTEGPPDAGPGSEPAAAVTGFEAPAPAEAPAMPGLLDAPAVLPDEPSAAPGPVDASQLIAAVAGGGSDADPDADQLTLF